MDKLQGQAAKEIVWRDHLIAACCKWRGHCSILQAE